jgi:hypothetical protein
MGQMHMSNGDEVEAIAPSHLPIMDFFGNRLSHLRAPAWPWSVTQIAELPYRRLTMVLPILIERFGDVAAETHFKPQLGCNQDSIGEAVLT